MGLSENLRRYRERAGYTMQEFSHMVNIPYGTYNSYETTTKVPRLDKLIKIADTLNISLDDLVGRKQKNEDEQLKQVIDEALANYPKISFKEFHEFKNNPGEVVKFTVTFNNGKKDTSYVAKDSLLLWIKTTRQNFSMEFKQAFREYIKEKIKIQIFRYCNIKISQYKAEYADVDFDKIDPKQLNDTFPAYVKWLNTINSVYETFDKEDSK